MASPLSGSAPPTTTKTTSGCVSRRRSAARKSSRKPFPQTRRPTIPTTTASPSTPRLARAFLANFILRFGTKSLQVDAVAEQHQLAARNAEACQHLKILGVLDKFGSRAHRGRPFEGVHHGFPRKRILRTGIEAVHGIDHSGHPGRTGSHPSVDARFGVVRVDDVGLESSEELPKLAQGQEVLADGGGPGGMDGEARGGCPTIPARVRTGREPTPRPPPCRLRRRLGAGGRAGAPGSCRPW